MGFALAVLLVAWAVDELAAVLQANWIVLLIAELIVLAGVVGIRVWWNRSGW